MTNLYFVFLSHAFRLGTAFIWTVLRLSWLLNRPSKKTMLGFDLPLPAPGIEVIVSERR